MAEPEPMEFEAEPVLNARDQDRDPGNEGGDEGEPHPERRRRHASYHGGKAAPDAGGVHNLGVTSEPMEAAEERGHTVAAAGPREQRRASTASMADLPRARRNGITQPAAVGSPRHFAKSRRRAVARSSGRLSPDTGAVAGAPIRSRVVDGQDFLHLTSGLGIAAPKTGLRRTLLVPNHRDDSACDEAAPQRQVDRQRQAAVIQKTQEGVRNRKLKERFPPHVVYFHQLGKQLASHCLQDGTIDTLRLWTRPDAYKLPHLYFESRFESGNLKRAVRCRLKSNFNADSRHVNADSRHFNADSGVQAWGGPL